MDAREAQEYEDSVRDVIGMNALILGRGRAGYEEFDEWIAQVRSAVATPGGNREEQSNGRDR